MVPVLQSNKAMKRRDWAGLIDVRKSGINGRKREINEKNNVSTNYREKNRLRESDDVGKSLD